ncbi:MAG TPA: hypothetical protein VLA56_14745 [Pseudomonadales bacterium]|nr:hypothetical protein [Pseudomonadales bacterium]
MVEQDGGQGVEQGGEEDREALVEAVGALAPVVLRTLAMLEVAQRHLHPPALESVGRELAPRADELAAASERFLAAPWPEGLGEFRDRMLEAAAAAAGACSGLAGLGAQAEDFITAIKALRRQVRALEALYELAPALPPISRFFLERDFDEASARALMALIDAAPGRGGVAHQDNARDERGGFSMYVPEWVAPGTPMPLIMALHGGSGHGRDFLWSWLREARTRGCLLVAPTSADRTWSMTGGEDLDAPRLHAIVDALCERFTVDRQRMLLTGMSDGATYTLLTGLREGSPFTALAPFSGMLSPEILMDGRLANASGRRIRLVHGVADWMFPVDTARDAVVTLETAGAEVEYRELEDLSHTYARDENPALLDWFGVPLPG